MWYLTSDHDSRVLFVVPQKSEIILGRNTEEHIFTNVEDRSISRQHASLTLTEARLFVTDLGSRYGTYINNSTDTIVINQSVELKDNDIVKFGKLNWEWRVHELNLTTCTSTLKGESLKTVKAILGKIGGILRNEWDESCSYLTMPVITLTIKVVLALVQGSYIVTTEFWNMCLEAVNNYSKLPNPENYTPQIVESALNKEMVSFLPNHNRRVIFINKKFVFLSKRQYEMYKQVLTKTSAIPLLLSDSMLPKSMLCEQNVIVIQNMSNMSVETQDLRDKINDIISYLKSSGKRLVADSEIGLAILYCSTEKYCNPDFNFPSDITKQTVQKNPSNILAQESQKPNTQSTQKESILINESVSDESTSKKRKLSDETDDVETSVSKKQAFVTNNSNIENTNKRKFDADNDTINNSNKRFAITQNTSESEDYFNFISPADNETKQIEKKLNLSKPLKRKHELENDDDLFNFIQLDEKSEHVCIDTTDTSKQLDNKNSSTAKVDILAMRGVKLQEIMNNTNWDQNLPTIKKEFNELDMKMNELNLGTTIVTVKNNLIIKKEVIEIKEQSEQCRNFKKFKKVWPLKMRVSIAQT